MARHARARRTSKVATGFVVAVTITAGAISHRAADWWPPAGPFVAGAAVGERVEVPPVAVIVHGARAGMVLADDLGDEQLTTDGVWIAVDVTVDALDEPSPVGEFELRDEQGRSYRQSNRMSNDMAGQAFEPGIAERGDVVFEVPWDALGALVLVVSPDSPGRVAPRGTAEIPLNVGDVSDEPLTPEPRGLVT